MNFNLNGLICLPEFDYDTYDDIQFGSFYILIMRSSADYARIMAIKLYAHISAIFCNTVRAASKEKCALLAYMNRLGTYYIRILYHPQYFIEPSVFHVEEKDMRYVSTLLQSTKRERMQCIRDQFLFEI